MKTKKVELEVDFIGEQTPLTKEEERLLGEFIQKLKEKRRKKFRRKQIAA